MWCYYSRLKKKLTEKKNARLSKRLHGIKKQRMLVELIGSAGHWRGPNMYIYIHCFVLSCWTCGCPVCAVAAAGKCILWYAESREYFFVVCWIWKPYAPLSLLIYSPADPNKFYIFLPLWRGLCSGDCSSRLSYNIGRRSGCGYACGDFWCDN